MLRFAWLAKNCIFVLWATRLTRSKVSQQLNINYETSKRHISGHCCNEAKRYGRRVVPQTCTGAANYAIWMYECMNLSAKAWARVSVRECEENFKRMYVCTLCMCVCVECSSGKLITRLFKKIKCIWALSTCNTNWQQPTTDNNNTKRVRSFCQLECTLND